MNPILLSSAFRKQVLSRLYGLPDPTESANQESEDAKPEEAKEANTDEKEKKDEPAKDDKTQEETEKEAPPREVDLDTPKVEVFDKSEKDKDAESSEHSNTNSNGDHTSGSGAIANNNSSSSKSITTHTTPTTTTSHLYSVLMAPLDGRSLYRDQALRSGVDHDTGNAFSIYERESPVH